MPARAATAVGAALIALAISSLGDTGAQHVRIDAGDTLSEIAGRHGVTVAALATANGIADANHIVAGTVVVVPSAAPRAGGAATHVVQPGDTLSGIAAEHGLPVVTLAAANDISNADYIVTGRRLTVPAGSSTTRPGRPAPLAADPARSRLETRFDTWARAYGVPPSLLKAVCWMESGWQNQVVSITGAVGIGQLTPAAVADVERMLGADLDPADPDDNIRMAARYLRLLLDATGGDVPTAVAAYHQGLRSVRENGVRPEIQAYVDAVLALRLLFS